MGIAASLVGVNPRKSGHGRVEYPDRAPQSFPASISLSFADVYLTAFPGNPVNYAIFLSQVNGVLRSHQVW